MHGPWTLAFAVATALLATCPALADRGARGTQIIAGPDGAVAVSGRVGVRGVNPIVWWSTYPTAPAAAKQSPYDFEVKPAGSLRLSVAPPDAEVRIDGYPIPAGHDSTVGLLVGPHEVEVRRDDYLPQRRQITIEAAKALHLDVKLERAAGEP